MSKTPIELQSLSGPAMGSRWTARMARGSATPELAGALAGVVAEIEAAASLWRADSALSRLNAAPCGDWVALPPMLADLLALSLRLGAETGGLFDIAMGGLSDAWGFGAAQGRTRPSDMSAPPRAASATARALELTATHARKHAPLHVSLDGVAKGYAVDKMAETAGALGVTQALFGLDGEMRALGPRPDGRPWGVAVEAPDPARRAAAGMLELCDLAVATSGDYRHFVTIRNQRIGHTMNPRTGLPARGPAGVTVLDASCARADAWATALMCLPPEAGQPLARAKGIAAIWA